MVDFDDLRDTLKEKGEEVLEEENVQEKLQKGKETLREKGEEVKEDLLDEEDEAYLQEKVREGKETVREKSGDVLNTGKEKAKEKGKEVARRKSKEFVQRKKEDVLETGRETVEKAGEELGDTVQDLPWDGVERFKEIDPESITDYLQQLPGNTDIDEELQDVEELIQRYGRGALGFGKDFADVAARSVTEGLQERADAVAQDAGWPDAEYMLSVHNLIDPGVQAVISYKVEKPNGPTPLGEGEHIWDWEVDETTVFVPEELVERERENFNISLREALNRAVARSIRREYGDTEDISHATYLPERTTDMFQGEEMEGFYVEAQLYDVPDAHDILPKEEPPSILE